MNYDFSTHTIGDTWLGVNNITVRSSGTPIDLTDCNITIQIRSILHVASPVFYQFSSEEGTILVKSQTQGILSIPPQIVDIPPGDYQHDLNIEFPTGIKKTYLRGCWKILPNMQHMGDCDVVVDDNMGNISVIVDDSSVNLNAYYQLLNNINSYILPLTAKWQETADEMDNYVQPLTAKWIETAQEMDTLQVAPTGHWQDVYEYIDRGVVDAGFF
jgi:hypothetical protein